MKKLFDELFMVFMNATRSLPKLDIKFKGIVLRFVYRKGNSIEWAHAKEQFSRIGIGRYESNTTNLPRKAFILLKAIKHNQIIYFNADI